MTTILDRKAPSAQRSSLTQAILWMAVALLSFSAIAVAGREGARALSTTEMIFWRSIVGAAVLMLVYRLRGEGPTAVLSQRLDLHGLRSMVHFCAQYAWLYALTLIPLAQLFALEFTAPLWVALLAPMVLGERLTPLRLGAAALGFAGALVVAEPGLFAGRFALSASAGTLFAIASAIGFAASMLITKRLTRVDPALRILFWMQALQAVIAGLILLGGIAGGRGWPASWVGAASWAAWGWVVVLALAGLTAHFGLTRAFSLADAIIVAPMDFLRLPLIAIVGAVIYGELLPPNVAIGAAIVVTANGLNMWAERRARAIAATPR